MQWLVDFVRAKRLYLLNGYVNLAKAEPPKDESDSEYSVLVSVKYFFNTWHEYSCRYHFETGKLYYIPSGKEKEEILEDNLDKDYFFWKEV